MYGAARALWGVLLRTMQYLKMEDGIISMLSGIMKDPEAAVLSRNVQRVVTRTYINPVSIHFLRMKAHPVEDTRLARQSQIDSCFPW